MNTARIIAQPSVDFDTLLGVAYEVFSEKLFTDGNKPVTDIEKFLTCLARLNNPGEDRQYLPYLFPHISVSVLAAYHIDDQSLVTTICADMSIAAREVGGGVLAVITGKLDEWHRVLTEGTQRDHVLFWSIVHEFDAHRLPHPCHTPRLR